MISIWCKRRLFYDRQEKHTIHISVCFEMQIFLYLSDTTSCHLISYLFLFVHYQLWVKNICQDSGLGGHSLTVFSVWLRQLKSSTRLRGAGLMGNNGIGTARAPLSLARDTSIESPLGCILVDRLKKILLHGVPYQLLGCQKLISKLWSISTNIIQYWTLHLYLLAMK